MYFIFSHLFLLFAHDVRLLKKKTDDIIGTSWSGCRFAETTEISLPFPDCLGCRGMQEMQFPLLSVFMRSQTEAFHRSIGN